MKFNAQKTQRIVLGTRQNLRHLPTISIRFIGATVCGSSTVRNLGVVFDQCMTFAAHTDDVVRRCTGLLIGLSHSRHSLPQTTLLPLVQALIISSTRYCVSVYGSCNASQISRLQKVMNFAARVISGRRKFDHISDVLRDLEWLTAGNLHEYHAPTLLKRLPTTGQTESLSAHIAHGHLHVPGIRSESGRRRFFYSTVTAFNALPERIRDANTRQFKTKLRRHLLQQQLDVR